MKSNLELISDIRTLLNQLETQIKESTKPKPEPEPPKPLPIPGLLNLKNGERLKWQPGHYLHIHINPQFTAPATVGETFQSKLEEAKNLLIQQPKLKGVKLTFPWGLIEKDQGVFDWSGLDHFINGFPQGKFIQLELKDRIFGPAWYWASTWFPKYLCTPETQRYTYTDTSNRIMPRLDSEEYYINYIRVLKEIGKRYSTNPKIVAVRYMNETSQAAPSNKIKDAFNGKSVSSQYEVSSGSFESNYRKNIDRIYDDIKDSFPGVCLCGSWNYYPGNIQQHQASLAKVLTQPRNAMNWPDSPVGLDHSTVRVTGYLSKPLRNIDRDRKWDFVVSVDGVDYRDYTQYAHEINFSIPARFIPFYYEKGWNNNFFSEGDIIINCDSWTGRIYKVGSIVKFDSGAELKITTVKNTVGWAVKGNAGTYDQIWALDNKNNTIMLLNEDATNLSQAFESKISSDWDGISDLSKNTEQLKKTYTYRIADMLINLYEAQMITWPTGAASGPAYGRYKNFVLYPALDLLGWKINENPPKNILG